MKCKICGKEPKDIMEYVNEAKVNEMEVEDFVRSYEMTLNEKTGKFYCTDCYIKIGMPSGKA